MKINSINVTNLNNIFELITKTKDNKNDKDIKTNEKKGNILCCCIV